LTEPADRFYGDRNAVVRDPFGNHWFIATYVEDISAQELAKREQAVPKKDSES